MLYQCKHQQFQLHSYSFFIVACIPYHSRSLKIDSVVVNAAAVKFSRHQIMKIDRFVSEKHFCCLYSHRHIRTISKPIWHLSHTLFSLKIADIQCILVRSLASFQRKCWWCVCDVRVVTSQCGIYAFHICARACVCLHVCTTYVAHRMYINVYVCTVQAAYLFL